MTSPALKLGEQRVPFGSAGSHYLYSDRDVQVLEKPVPPAEVLEGRAHHDGLLEGVRQPFQEAVRLHDRVHVAGDHMTEVGSHDHLVEPRQVDSLRHVSDCQPVLQVIQLHLDVVVQPVDLQHHRPDLRLSIGVEYEPQSDHHDPEQVGQSQVVRAGVQDSHVSVADGRRSRIDEVEACDEICDVRVSRRTVNPNPKAGERVAHEKQYDDVRYGSR